MNEFINFLSELGNVPIITIPLGAILGAIVTYILTIKQKKNRDEQLTKQILPFINIEIYENFANRINSNYPYNELTLKGLDLINMQAGNIRLNNKQLKRIYKIYSLFNRMNKKILSAREEMRQARGTDKTDEEIKNLQKKCSTITSGYIEEYYSDQN